MPNCGRFLNNGIIKLVIYQNNQIAIQLYHRALTLGII